MKHTYHTGLISVDRLLDMRSIDQLMSLCNAVPDQQPLTTACLSDHPLLLKMVLRTRNAVARLPLPWPRCSTTTHPWLGQVQHCNPSFAGAGAALQIHPWLGRAHLLGRVQHYISSLAGAAAALQFILGWDRCMCWDRWSTTNSSLAEAGAALQPTLG